MDALSAYQIKKFFEQFSPIPQDVCDNTAAGISSSKTVEPTPTQGSQSYTVRVGDGANGFVVQFRDPNYPLDMDVLKAAKETYGRLVPGCQLLQGQLDPLHVYKMNDVSGEALLLVNTFLHLPSNVHLLSQTVEDFAVFSASAWRRRPTLLPTFSNASIQSDYCFRLGRISDGLPDDFQPLLNKLQQKLPSLFANGYHMVINHWDLLENNIHVDVQTGHITGIVDWRDAKVGPFAIQIWGLENILGIRKSTGMSYHPQHVRLRQAFWQKLYEGIGSVSKDTQDAIRTARMIGIFLANGDFATFPADERDRELAVLRSMISQLPDIGL